jgi:uncharacterized protein YdbL (DUF1318 family)
MEGLAMKTMKSIAAAGAVSLLALGILAAPAQAQRDPAYAAARSSGEIGEKMDGYLGIVGTETPELRRLVNDINIKRRAVYAQKSQEEQVTLDEYALATGCQLILKTVPGEKYQAPGGVWETRTSAPPKRDPRCPPA